jgi:sucrose-6-phosphate hydrolase SacC (GH32 family)
MLTAMPLALKPLFRDPVYDGAADPVVIWNRGEKCWFMLYTNRRATMTELPGVAWVHGTRIGIASSRDGAAWTYRGMADIRYGAEDDAHWAPDVLWHDGQYHMFLTHVTGMHTDWAGTRDIVHLVSDDLLTWTFDSAVDLVSRYVIDPSVVRLPGGTWRMWYNSEPENKAIRYADSPDLRQWRDIARVPTREAGEGPKVFNFKGRWWMIVDHWKGQGVYHSIDAITWTEQPGYLVAGAGTGVDETDCGRHADVIVNGGRAYLFYFTHPGRSVAAAGVETRRSAIQVTELFVTNGQLVCDRDRPTEINLQPPE